MHACTHAFSCLAPRGIVRDVVLLSVLTREGAVLASAGSPSEATLVAAIASNMFESYGRHGLAEPLGMVVVDCDNGKVLVMRINDSLLLCLYAKGERIDSSVVVKARALVEHLQGPLSEVNL